MLIEEQSTSNIDLIYNGEFGTELQTLLPYAYFLFQQGRLGTVTACRDTKCFYYFAEQHQERFNIREYLEPHHPYRTMLPNPDEHVDRLETSCYTPPPYKSHYANNRFVWKKRPLIICNKYNTEWNHSPVNYLDLPTLEALFSALGDTYQLIYVRPSSGHIVNDNSDIRELEDDKLLERFPGILTIQSLHESNPDLSFNMLQLMVFANCSCFISVQGGNSVLASYFGGSNLVFAVKGKELIKGDFNYYHLFAGTKVIPVGDRQKILTYAKRLYLRGQVMTMFWSTVIPFWALFVYRFNILHQTLRTNYQKKLRALKRRLPFKK